MISLHKLAEQQEEQRALKSKNRTLKQTHDLNLAESLSPTTKKVDKSTKEISKILKNQILRMVLNLI